MHIEILQTADIQYSNDQGAGFYSEVFTSGGCSSGGDFNAGYAEFRRRVSQGCERRCSSGGFRAVGILTQGTRSSGAGFRNVSSAGFRAVSYFVRAALTVWATFSK